MSSDFLLKRKPKKRCTSLLVSVPPPRHEDIVVEKRPCLAWEVPPSCKIRCNDIVSPVFSSDVWDKLPLNENDSDDMLLYTLLREAADNDWFPITPQPAIHNHLVTSVPTLTIINVQQDFPASETTLPCKETVAASQRKVALHYRGVRQSPWGKFVAEIQDPTKKGACVWLGTFETAEAATLTDDHVAFKIPGSKALLNFPLLHTTTEKKGELDRLSKEKSLAVTTKRKREVAEDLFTQFEMPFILSIVDEM